MPKNHERDDKLDLPPPPERSASDAKRSFLAVHYLKIATAPRNISRIDSALSWGGRKGAIFIERSMEASLGCCGRTKISQRLQEHSARSSLEAPLMPQTPKTLKRGCRAKRVT